MTEALTTTDGYIPLSEYSDKDIRTYKRALHCEDCTTDEWRMLEVISSTYKLNPFLKEVWLIPKVGVTVGIAGFLKLAHRSGNFAGMITDTKYAADGVTPISHTTTVWLKDSDKPVTKTIVHREFERKGTNGKTTNWDKMPVYMGEKVSEVHALKRAFSLFPLYSPEELGYEDISAEPTAEPYTATIDGEPVTVEPLRKEEAKPTPKPEPAKPEKILCTCGNEPMIDLERRKYEKVFDEQDLGEIPANLCKICVEKLWRFRTDEKKKNPYGMKPAQESEVDKNGTVMAKPREPAKYEKVAVAGVEYDCKCFKCGAPLNKNQFAGAAYFAGEKVFCKQCDSAHGIQKVKE